MTQKIEEMLLPLLEGTDIFLVSLKIKPINNIKIYLDADDGFPISKSTSINRQLRHKIDEAALFPEGDYSLEVSSPGIDEPLIFHRQYYKNIGRKIEITPNEGVVILGKLVAVDEEKVSVEIIVNPKKKEVSVIEIPFGNIKQSIVQITF